MEGGKERGRGREGGRVKREGWWGEPDIHRASTSVFKRLIVT